MREDIVMTHIVHDTIVEEGSNDFLCCNLITIDEGLLTSPMEPHH